MINCNCFNELMLKVKTFLNEGFNVNEKTINKVSFYFDYCYIINNFLGFI